MLTVPIHAKAIFVSYAEDAEVGLVFATSRDLPGLLIAATSRESAVAKTPAVISNLYLACGAEVIVEPIASVLNGDEIFQVTQAT